MIKCLRTHSGYRNNHIFKLPCTKTESKLSFFILLEILLKTKQLLASKHTWIILSASQKSLCFGLWISLAGMVFTF